MTATALHERDRVVITCDHCRRAQTYTRDGYARAGKTGRGAIPCLCGGPMFPGERTARPTPRQPYGGLAA